MAVGSAPAMATVHWKDATHGIKLSGGWLNVSSPGETTKKCSPPTTQSYELGTASAYIWNVAPGELHMPCEGGGYLGIIYTMNATTVNNLEFGMRYTYLQSPWSWHYEETSPIEGVTFHNKGEGKYTASLVNFQSSTIGYAGFGVTPVTAQGQLLVTNELGESMILEP
jgi:hypothetical protein